MSSVTPVGSEIQKTLSTTSDCFTVFTGTSNILEYLIYFDGIYLVVKNDDKVECYRLDDTFEEIVIRIGGITDEVYGREIKKNELPQKAKNILMKEMI